MRLLCLSARPRERGVCRFGGECKANLQTQLFRSVDGGLRKKRDEWIDLESGGCMMEVVSRSDLSLCSPDCTAWLAQLLLQLLVSSQSKFGQRAGWVNGTRQTGQGRSGSNQKRNPGHAGIPFPRANLISASVKYHHVILRDTAALPEYAKSPCLEYGIYQQADHYNATSHADYVQRNQTIIPNHLLLLVGIPLSPRHFPLPSFGGYGRRLDSLHPGSGCS